MAITLLAGLLSASGIWADEDAKDAALAYDGVNMPIEQVIEKATAADKPIFLEFYTEG
jgi:hypothetical protein